MTGIRKKFAVRATLFGACLTVSSALWARDAADQQTAGDDREPSWYHASPASFKPDTKAIIFQRANFRAQQREQRLAAMSWYGMYNARPTASSTPFTSMYSPAWQSPGGRPFAWNSNGPPAYVIYTR